MFKFLYRLSGAERKFDFFRSRTFDFASFSFNDTRQGAQIAIPTTYLSNSKEEFLRDQPLGGFNTLMGQKIDFDTIRQTLNDEKAFTDFIENCFLSEEAKLFALARAVAETDNFLLTNLDAFIGNLIIF